MSQRTSRGPLEGLCRKARRVRHQHMLHVWCQYRGVPAMKERMQDSVQPPAAALQGDQSLVEERGEVFRRRNERAVEFLNHVPELQRRQVLPSFIPAESPRGGSAQGATTQRRLIKSALMGGCPRHGGVPD